MAFNEKELEIISFGIQQGKSREEVERALSNFRLGIVPQQKEPGFTERAGDVLEAGFAEAGEALQGKGEFEDRGAVRRGLEAGAAITTSGVGALTEALPQPVRKGLGFVGEKFQQGIDFLGNLIGSTEVAQQFVTEHPEAADRLEELAGAGQAAGEIAGAGLLVRGGVTGATKATQLAKKTSGAIARQTTKALQGINLTGTQGITLAGTGERAANIMQRVARISKAKQANFEKMANQSIGSYLVDRGIFGNIDEITTQLHKRFTQSKGAADRGFAQLPGNYRNTAVGNALKQLVERERAVSTPGAVSRDLARINELQKIHRTKGLTMTEINEVKRFFERKVKLDFLKENKPLGVEQSNNLDSAIRRFQLDKANELGFKNVKQINQETRLAKQLLDDLGREYAGSAGNNAITLTDWIVLAEGNPAAVAAFLTKKAASSKKIQAEIARKIAPEPRVGIPTPDIDPGTVDGFIEFLKRNPIE